MKRTFLAVVLCSVVLCLGVGALHANVMFALGNNPQPGEVNVLAIKGETGFTVMGHTNTKPSVTVDFTSTEKLLQNSGGQAQVTGCAAPCTAPFKTSPIDNIKISLENNLTYGDLIVDPHITNDCHTCGGTITILVMAELGGTPETFTFSRPITKGENFFTLTTSGGEGIISTLITDTGGGTGNFSDLRQIRLSGIAGVVPVPEPSTYAPLLALVSWLSVKWRRGILR